MPAEIRLFLEFRGLPAPSSAPAGAGLVNLIGNLLETGAHKGPTQPAGGAALFRVLPWPNRLAGMLGLKEDKITDALFSGPIAVAAESWTGLGDAVLVAEPGRIKELEELLAPRLTKEAANKRVRYYRSQRGHELASNGRYVLLGKSTPRSGLYARIADFWESGQGTTLGSVPEFRERMAALPAGASLTLYVNMAGSARSGGETTVPFMGCWPGGAAEVDSAALGLAVAAGKVTVATSSRLVPPVPRWSPTEPPIHSLLRLPSSTVAAWTQTINYVEEYRRLDKANPEGAIRFYINVLRTGLAAGEVETRLLSHLLGDSVVIVGQKSVPPASAGTVLILPIFTLIVETDNPQSVDATLKHMAGNLLRLLNLSTGAKPPVGLKKEPVDEKGYLNSISLERLFDPAQDFACLGHLEMSWAILNRTLIIGTHSALVRQIIEAQRGAGATLSVQSAHEALEQIHRDGGWAELILVAQPQMAGAMIDSWINYVSLHHPQILENQWWRHLWRKQRASDIQMGILFSRKLASEGILEVAQTMPNWPAHGYLQSGDRILLVDGQQLDPANKPESLSDLIAGRRHLQYLTLRILREGRLRDVYIPMPAARAAAEHTNPLPFLRQLADLLRLFPAATYTSWRAWSDVRNTRLELTMHPTTAPP